jgi:O-antigen/teichoic acid export membrane protein
MISVNLYSYVDTVILGAMRSNAETGYYGAAYRVYEGLTYPPSIVASLVTPRLSFLFVHERHRVRALLTRVVSGAAIMGVVLGGAGVVAAAPLVTFLFGSDFAAAAMPLRILSGGAVFVFCTWILHAAAIATNLDRRLFLTTVIGLGTNVLLNVLFIPRWGMNGAASATVIAEALTVALLLSQLRRHLSEP